MANVMNMGGPPAQLELLAVDSNGSYLPSPGYDGFSSVLVDLPLDQGIFQSNGTYFAADDNLQGYNKVIVNTPLPVLKTKQITQNGTYYAQDDNAAGYSIVEVNIPGVLTGSTAPSDDIGSNGDYYYRRQQTILNYDNGTTRGNPSGNSSNTNVGYMFRTNSAITVSALRYYVHNTGTPVTVTLYNSSKVAVATATETPTTTGWHDISITPVTLTTNSNYYIMVSANTNLFSYWAISGVTADSSITLLSGIYSTFIQDTTNMYSADIVIDKSVAYTHEYVYEQYYKSSGHWDLIVPV